LLVPFVAYKISKPLRTDGNEKYEELIQIFPNPFILSTTILLNLHTESDVTLELYDINGRIIKKFLNKKFLPSGPHKFT